MLIGCAQHEGASTPQGLPTQHARVRAVLRSREGSLPNQKKLRGSPELCVSRLSFRKCPHWLSLGQDPPDAASTCFRSAKRNEHRRPVIARIASVQAAAHKSWIAADVPSNQSGCGRRRETFDKRKENKPRQIPGLVSLLEKMKAALVPIELVIKAEPDHVHGHLVCRDIHARTSQPCDRSGKGPRIRTAVEASIKIFSPRKPIGGQHPLKPAPKVQPDCVPVKLFAEQAKKAVSQLKVLTSTFAHAPPPVI